MRSNWKPTGAFVSSSITLDTLSTGIALSTTACDFSGEKSEKKGPGENSRKTNKPITESMNRGTIGQLHVADVDYVLSVLRIAVANALARLASGATGNFQINGNLTNAGLAQLSGSGEGNTLTVTGNYIGQNVTIALNTYLAGDSVASDKMVVSGGTASSTSTLNVQNAGGPGAETLTDGNMRIPEFRAWG